MAKKVDLVLGDSIDENSRWPYVIAVVSFDLTGYSAEMVIKDKREPTGVVLLDLSSYLAVDSIDGLINIDVPATVLASQTWTAGEYDVSVLISGQPDTRRRVMQGRVTLSRGIING